MRPALPNFNDKLLGLIIVIYAVIILAIFGVIGCYPAHNPNCDCEITTDGDERYMTFMLKGCHFCCWYATIEACERTQIDSIGEAFYNHTISDDPVCEWENVAWSWEYGRVQ